ncbi:hypothetical protein [Candidatus Electronema sp. PJ]|uniref:hypothetical protein n=1 Tax=Candidatus Electronema sp. PJ TaxID=3401572 RepID=UPI003AA82686
MNAELQKELHADIEAIQGQLHITRKLLAGKIEKLSARINLLDELTAQMADSGQVEALSCEVKGAVASLAGIEGAVGSMKACVEQTARQILEMSPEKVIRDISELLVETQQPEVIDIAPLEKDIALMQQELVLVREKADRALLAASTETVLHADK